jgi:hypothetical protein
MPVLLGPIEGANLWNQVPRSGSLTNMTIQKEINFQVQMCAFTLPCRSERIARVVTTVLKFIISSM